MWVLEIFYLKIERQTNSFLVIEEMDTTCQRTPQKRRGAISAEVYTEEEVSLLCLRDQNVTVLSA